jgi:hypothetical protein
MKNTLTAHVTAKEWNLNDVLYGSQETIQYACQTRMLAEELAQRMQM